MVTGCCPHPTRKLGLSKSLKNQKLTRSAHSYVEQILLGDPNHLFCPALAGITLRWRGPANPNLQRHNLGQWTSLITHGTSLWPEVSLLENKKSVIWEDLGHGGSEPCHQSTLLPMGKRPRHLHFQEKIDMWPLFLMCLKLSGVLIWPCVLNCLVTPKD